MESGTINRTTASTNMNATSSRSHMVITIRFEQVIYNARLSKDMTHEIIEDPITFGQVILLTNK